MTQTSDPCVKTCFALYKVLEIQPGGMIVRFRILVDVVMISVLYPVFNGHGIGQVRNVA
jgi:hypothetical protein